MAESGPDPAAASATAADCGDEAGGRANRWDPQHPSRRTEADEGGGVEDDERNEAEDLGDFDEGDFSEDEDGDVGSIDSREEQEAARTQLRKQIIAVQADTSLSMTEKSKRIQALMTSKWLISHPQPPRVPALEGGAQCSEPAEEERRPTYHHQESMTLGCKHYQRAAKLQANCCGRWYTCRFCHDQANDHAIVRNQTKNMLCMYCSTTQPAAQYCKNERCRMRLGRYYCNECKLWDDDPRKNIYHCPECKICRIGKGLGEDFFHCKKCNVCMALGLQGKHKCIERNLESDCPICGEYMFTSTTTVIFMPCGHCIHFQCHEEYIKTSYVCPTCFKSMADMSSFFERIDAVLAQQKMPPEYDDHVSEILCNDCERSSRAKYNFLYHKCAYCASYNTKVLRTLKPGDVDQDAEGGRTSEIPGSLSSVAAARPPSWTPTDGDTAADQVAALALDNPENLPTGNGEVAHRRTSSSLSPYGSELILRSTLVPATLAAANPGLE